MSQNTEELRSGLTRLIQGVDACRGNVREQLRHLKGMLTLIVDFIVDIKKSA